MAENDTATPDQRVVDACCRVLSDHAYRSERPAPLCRVNWPLPGKGRVFVMEWPSDVTPAEWAKLRQVIDLCEPGDTGDSAGGSVAPVAVPGP
jgi:hypothetical protein